MKNNKRTAHISYLNRSGRSSNEYIVPFIRLSGMWIQDAGLQIGDGIEINIGKSKITITKLKQTNQNEKDHEEEKTMPGHKKTYYEVFGTKW